MKLYKPCQVEIYVLEDEDVVRTSQPGTTQDPFEDKDWWEN